VLQLNFPQYTFNFREGKKSLEIFCLSRKKWVVLTPEEWVRQNTLAHLVHHAGFSIQWIAAEYAWGAVGGKGRSDIVVFKGNGNVLGIVECKAPVVKLDQENSHQLMSYQHFSQPKWVILTNGMQHLFWDVTEQKHLEDWPKAIK
jgi:hypothetical protein